MEKKELMDRGGEQKLQRNFPAGWSNLYWTGLYRVIDQVITLAI
jgi:hypothetical protein